MDASARPNRRLIWKYAAVVVTLVAAAVLSVGLTELYFSYQDSKKALTRVERDKASSAATSIEQRMQEILRGASPADLAVEEVPTVEFAINLKTAGRLGIKPPQDMIIKADEVYR